MLAASTTRDDSGVVELVPGIRQIEGTVTQRYRLLSKIGVGGMGDVFLGIQKGAVDFQRLIVLKRIHSHLLQNQSHAKMFVDEASLVAKLNHPNIVNIIDFRQTTDAFFIVMEYVDGETLRTIRAMCAKRRIVFPFPLACKLMISACDALNYAHNATSHTGEPLNIIHRDIGLHNLMIDRNGYLKVIDFGIAKSTIQTDFTMPDVIKGNPSYMAPDIFAYEKIDHRVDIYALGLSLFELLTSERVFKFGKNIPLSKVIQQITREEIPAPSSIIPSIPKKLDAIVKKATDKERDRRYQTVAEFADDLQHVARNHASAFRKCNAKEWFYEHFSKRFEERIHFEQELLAHAEATSSKGINSYTPPPAPESQTDVSITFRNASNQSSPQHVWQTQKKTRLIIGGVVATLVLAFGSLMIFIFQPSEQPVVNQTENTAVGDDNLLIKSTPPGADIFINGDRVGTTSETGEYFRVSPNAEHKVVIKKTNYEDYFIKITVPKTGHRRINASLVAESITTKEPTTPSPEDTSSEKQHTVIQSEEQSATTSKSQNSRRTWVKKKAKSDTSQPLKTSPETKTSPTPSVTKPEPTVPLLEKTPKNNIPLLDKKPDSVPLL